VLHPANQKVQADRRKTRREMLAATTMTMTRTKQSLLELQIVPHEYPTADTSRGNPCAPRSASIHSSGRWLAGRIGHGGGTSAIGVRPDSFTRCGWTVSDFVDQWREMATSASAHRDRSNRRVNEASAAISPECPVRNRWQRNVKC
jgi:hypothetical protein